MEEVDEKTQALIALRLSADISNIIREEVRSMLGDMDFSNRLISEGAIVPLLGDVLFKNYGFRRNLHDAIVDQIRIDKALPNAVQR